MRVHEGKVAPYQKEADASPISTYREASASLSLLSSKILFLL